MQIVSTIIFIYAGLVLAGGVMGYVKAKSHPSLIAGVISAIILLTAGYALANGQHWGFPLSLVVIALLGILFGTRYWRSAPRAFMPAGLMTILSFLAFVAIVLAGRGR